jgi:hypothetical protein
MDQQIIDYSLTVTPMPFTPNQVIDPEDGSNNELKEFNELSSMVKDLTSDMFVDKLLLDYNNSESSIDRLRMMLFEILKNSDDFPFDIDSDLKRRVNTRQGETAAAKLARDVHSLLLVIEGSDASEIKDMISTSKRSTRNGSVSKPIKHNIVGHVDSCVCSAELQNMKETISTLQADLLLIKQRQAATENIKNAELKEIKDTINELKGSVKRSEDSILESTKYLKDSISTLESIVKDDRIRCKGEMLKNLQSICKVQQQLEDTNRSIQQIKSSLSMYSTVEHGKANYVAAPVDSLNNCTATPNTNEIQHSEDLIEHADTPLVSNDCQDRLYSEVVCNPPSVGNNRENDSLFGNMKIPVVESRRNDTKQHKNNSRRKKGINFAIINRNLSENKNKRQNTFRKHMGGNYDRDWDDNDDDGNFDQYIRRRTKRFYLGGFRSSITESKLANYITKRGPKVTKISIFRKRKFPSSVTIRVNVEDDENVSGMTDDPYFWPKGVICRPWLSQGAYQSRMRARRDHHYDDYSERDRSHSSHGDSTDYLQRDDNRPSYRDWTSNWYSSHNRFSGLDTDVE